MPTRGVAPSTTALEFNLFNDARNLAGATWPRNALLVDWPSALAGKLGMICDVCGLHSTEPFNRIGQFLRQRPASFLEGGECAHTHQLQTCLSINCIAG